MNIGPVAGLKYPPETETGPYVRIFSDGLKSLEIRNSQKVGNYVNFGKGVCVVFDYQAWKIFRVLGTCISIWYGNNSTNRRDSNTSINKHTSETLI